MIPSSNQVDVIVLGASPTGLYAVREAAKFGCRVAIADVNAGCAFHSRFISTHDCFQGDLDSIKNWMYSVAQRGAGKPVIIPTNDVFIEFIISNADSLSCDFLFSDAYSGVAEQLLDKKLFHDLCVKFNVDTPGVWTALDKEALLSLTSRVPYPCLLKPTLIHRARGYLNGKKVLIARTASEFESLVSSMPDGLGEWLVQEIIPGPESRITLLGAYVNSDGRPVQAFSARKLRQYPPGFGSASLVLSRRCEKTEELSMALLSNIGFRGVCGVEFKFDSRDNKLKIIEVNPRPTLWFQITYDSGKRIVSSMIADLLGKAAPADSTQDESVRWRYALKDAYSRLFYFRVPDDFVLPPGEKSGLPNRVKSSWPVFSFADPKPALFEPIGYIRKLWSRL